MNHYLVDVRWLSEAFGGARSGKFDFKPIDDANICSYLRKCGKF